jgi:hypothetical protein
MCTSLQPHWAAIKERRTVYMVDGAGGAGWGLPDLPDLPDLPGYLS